MNKPSSGTIAALVLALAAGLFLGWRLGAHDAPPASATSADAHKILYWYDPMKPEAHFAQLGKSPFMDMALVPRYADEARSENSASCKRWRTMKSSSRTNRSPNSTGRP